MLFNVKHTTRYDYSAPASESFAELRVWPQSSASQIVRKRKLTLSPQVPLANYTDYFGNKVEFFSIPFRHTSLSVNAHAEVETIPVEVPLRVLEAPRGEAAQIYNNIRFRLLDFLLPTELTPPDAVAEMVANLRASPEQPIGEFLRSLNRHIHENFRYVPGVTEISTPLHQVVSQRRGVCQDFAHLLLAILRSLAIPARYVSGYIEAFDPNRTAPNLVGAAASHAWVEAYLPGEHWWGLDPTNNQVAGQRHVKVAVGRDYHDVAPMKGTYKGLQDQKLQVIVSLKRKEDGSTLPS